MREHLTWPLLAVSLVVGLAALVRMANPAGDAGDHVTGVIRLPWQVTASIIGLFLAAGLVFLLGLMRRMRSRRHGEDEEVLGPEAPRVNPWLRALAQILSVLNFVALAYLLWRSALPFGALISQGPGAGAVIVLPGEAPASAPFLVTWTFAVLALVGGLGALALALWMMFSDRLAAWWERYDDVPAPPPLAEAVDESVEDLRAEPDARRAIIRCYARFERAAAGAGLARRPWHTPMEFMREALGRLPAPRGAVRALTGLFELARFSDRTLGPRERDRALDALIDIKAAIDEGRPDAVAH